MSEQPLVNAGQGQVLNLAQETQFAPNGIVSRTLLKGPNVRVVLFGFDQGQELSEHTSPHRALVQILTGECEFALGPQWHKLKAGDWLHMPPNLPHAVRATQAFSMLLTLIKAEA
ncbi:MAG: cupin domain-containing protein [Verrucomicrobiae bacterium]|nr:cupin domain-containing protein [Verrucomicrobiae bacterium]